MSNQTITFILSCDQVQENMQSSVNDLQSNVEQAQFYQIANYRTANNQKEVVCNEDDVIVIELDDGTEWISSALDVHEIFSENQKRGVTRSAENVQFVVPSFLDSSDQKRGGISRAIKWFKRLIVRKIAANADEAVALALAKKCDKKAIENEGLYQVDESFVLKNVEAASIDKESTYLLLLHGTCSSTYGAFSAFKEDQSEGSLWSTLYREYNGNILAYDHPTISVCPITNAINILNSLPEGMTIDILSHSRGGIIADLLCRCYFNGEETAFSDDEIERYEADMELWQSSFQDELITDIWGSAWGDLKELNRCAIDKKLNVEKVIRVASPSRGTELLGSRIDHYLNGLLWVSSKALPGIGQTVANPIRNFLMDVIKHRANAHIFPGLVAMIPDAPLPKLLNNPEIKVPGSLWAIEGDSDIAGILRSIKVIFMNLYFRKANDMVVDTDSMRYGVIRENGWYTWTVENGQIYHSNYFSQSESVDALFYALGSTNRDSSNQWSRRDSLEAQRGNTLRELQFKEFMIHEEPSYTKPLVILLPGNLASHIYHVEQVNSDEFRKKDKVWGSVKTLCKGRLADSVGGNIKATSIFEAFYKDLVDVLRDGGNGFDVVIHPYDWRVGVQQAAKDLRETIEEHLAHTSNIRLLAHSLGGLVIRQLMMDDRECEPAKSVWPRLNENPDFRCIMMGTPWHGSYAAVKALFGKGQIATIITATDQRHSKKETIAAFQKFYGIYQMLPLDDVQVAHLDYWKEWKGKASLGRLFLPFEPHLERFEEDAQAFRNFVIPNGYVDKIHYVKGTDKETDEKPYISRSIFGKKLKFHHTAHGDGVVSWKLGIPKELPEENIWKSASNHNRLMADRENFAGIIRLLNGNAFRGSDAQQPITFRSDTAVYVPEFGQVDHRSPVFKMINFYEEEQSQQNSSISVSITHGDLQFSKYPVMVGHFRYDGIVSAESALDRSLEGTLSEQHRLREYPNEPGEQLIIYNPSKSPAGAIVVGMGSPEELNESVLTRTVRSAIIKYGFHIKNNIEGNNCSESEGRYNQITAVCISSDFGGLSLKTSMRAIINGVIYANERLSNVDNGKYLIKKIGFVNYYEDIARKALYELRDLKEEITKVVIHLNNQIISSPGGKRRVVIEDGNDWWHSLSTKNKKYYLKEGDEFVEKHNLEFMASGKLARADERDTTSTIANIYAYLRQLGKHHKYDPKTSKTLFEILIPPSLKSILRAQHNIHWKLDARSAAIPWELIHDTEISEEPTFVNAGLVRQLVNPNLNRNIEISTSRNALIIADPIYELPEFKPLEGAFEEGRAVKGLMGNHYDVHLLERTGMIDIYNELFSGSYRFIHIAGHGVYDHNGKTGIVVGDTFIAPGDINQIPVVPQFVFVNCCYSGTGDFEGDEYRLMNELAANIGQQFIRLGVHAVVVTGWPVSDAAALHFAQRFYKLMLGGECFGEAIKVTRKECYLKFGGDSTWAAYQAYGDPYYTFKKSMNGNNEKGQTYATLEEAIVDLQNLTVKCRTIESDKVKENLGDLAKTLVKVKRSGFRDDARICELEANIYHLSGSRQQAMETFQKLIKINAATYSIQSLEQFFNLESQLCSFGKLKGHSYEQISVDEREHLLGRQRSLVEYSNTCILFLGETIKRYCLIGDMYKRFAIFGNRVKKDYLQKMYENYARALELTNGDLIGDYFHPLLNLYIGHLLYKHRSYKSKTKTHPIGHNTIVVMGNVWAFEDIFGEIRKELELFDAGEQYDYRMQLYLSQLDLVTLITEPASSKRIEKLKGSVISRLTSIMSKQASVKDLQEEYDNYHFLVNALDDGKKHPRLAEVKAIFEVLKGLV